MNDCKHPSTSIYIYESTPTSGYCNDCKKHVNQRNLKTHPVPCERCGCPMSCKLIDNEYHCICDVKTCDPCGLETVKTIWFTA